MFERLGQKLVACGALVVLGSALGACDGSPSNPGSGGAGGQGAGATGEGGLFAVGGGPPDGTIDENSACATSVIQGQTLSVTMLIMFDKSGSMLENQKWANAKAALIAFFQSDATAGMSVGLRFFPDDAPVPGCNDAACNIDACATPLVSPAPLTEAPASGDPQQKALIDAVNAKSPSGETPMFAALGGAEQWATQNAKPGEVRTVVVLVTDGEPTKCNTDIAAIAQLAKEAKDGADVFTYAIGMEGSDAAQLAQIATAGGTEAIVVGAENVTSELLAALSGIKKTEVSCSYPMPESDVPGQPADPTKVNVNYYKGGGKPETLPKVASEADCGATYGWYYDNPASPTQIFLCPTTCAEAQSDPDAIVKILVGCATIAK